MQAKGWSAGPSPDGALELLVRALPPAEGAGVRMITVHGRTRQQFYTGQADWLAIADVVRAVSVPVIANGDIDGPLAARQALALSGAAGVMVGRAAQGRPWLLAQIGAARWPVSRPDTAGISLRRAAGRLSRPPT